MHEPLPPNLTDALGRQAELRPQAPALVWPDGRWSFLELDALVWRLGARLLALGVREGDIVGLSARAERDLVPAMLAVARIGATVFSVPQGLPAPLADTMIREAGVRLLLRTRGTPPAAGPAPAGIELDVDEAAADTSPIDRSVRAEAPRAPWLLISGSGSTGTSKRIPVTHAQHMARMAPAIEMYDRGERERIASMIHLDHASAKGRCLDVMFTGGALVLLDRARMDVVAECRRHEVTVLFASVVHVEALLRSLPGNTAQVLGGLRILYVGSSTVSEALRARIARQLTPNLHVRYGTNESGLISLATPEQIARTPGTVGRPVANVQVEVVDALGRRCAPGEIGRVRVRSPGMFSGYEGDPEATRRCFEDGWFVPGDLARCTPEGELVYCGRSDHMMIVDGINVYPAEIERVLCSHPAVRDAAAVPLRSDVHQDVPVCAVVLHQGARASESALRRFAIERLGARAPRRIMVVERIPRNELGKLVRAELGRALLDAFDAAHASPAARRRQARRSIRVNVPLPDDGDTALLDGWLAGELEMRLPTPAPPSPPEPEPAPGPATAAGAQARPGGAAGGLLEPQARHAMERCLALANTLLQAGSVPAFDAGEVTGLARAAGGAPGWTATFELADVAHLDARCYELAVREAATLVCAMLRTPRTPAGARKLHERLERATAALRRHAPGGKSTLPLLRAAHGLDIPFQHLGGGVYQLGWGSRALRTDRSSTALDSALGARLAQSKRWSAAVFATAGLPTPQHEIAGSLRQAMEAAARLGWPVVVKPVDLDAGKGVSVGVTNPKQLEQAVRHASERSGRRHVLVEREVPGVCHRLFVAAGRLLYAVRRLPKSVHGDGRGTVAELVARANARERTRPPWLRTEPFPLDDAAREAMSLAGFEESSVPPAGTPVPLRRIESTEWGGYDEEVGAVTHPDNIEIAVRAARLLGLQVAGVDIISPDITRPWHENGAVINEVNFAPQLGGGETSRRHIPEYLARFVRGDGRIPVEAVVGEDPGLAHARGRQRILLARGLRCFVTGHADTITDDGRRQPMAQRTLSGRLAGLLLDDRVDAIVLSMTTDEALHAGLPVDRISGVTLASQELEDHRAPGRPAAAGSAERLLELLDGLKTATASAV